VLGVELTFLRVSAADSAMSIKPVRTPEVSGCGLQKRIFVRCTRYQNKKVLTLSRLIKSAYLLCAEEYEISSFVPQTGGIPEEFDNLAKSHFV